MDKITKKEADEAFLRIFPHTVKYTEKELKSYQDFIDTESESMQRCFTKYVKNVCERGEKFLEE